MTQVLHRRWRGFTGLDRRPPDLDQSKMIALTYPSHLLTDHFELPRPGEMSRRSSGTVPANVDRTGRAPAADSLACFCTGDLWTTLADPLIGVGAEPVRIYRRRTRHEHEFGLPKGTRAAFRFSVQWSRYPGGLFCFATGVVYRYTLLPGTRY